MITPAAKDSFFEGVSQAYTAESLCHQAQNAAIRDRPNTWPRSTPCSRAARRRTARNWNRLRRQLWPPRRRPPENTSGASASPSRAAYAGSAVKSTRLATRRSSSWPSRRRRTERRPSRLGGRRRQSLRCRRRRSPGDGAAPRPCRPSCLTESLLFCHFPCKLLLVLPGGLQSQKRNSSA